MRLVTDPDLKLDFLWKITVVPAVYLQHFVKAIFCTCSRVKPQVSVTPVLGVKLLIGTIPIPGCHWMPP